MQEARHVQHVLPEHIREVQDNHHVQHVKMDIIVQVQQIGQRVQRDMKELGLERRHKQMDVVLVP